ncbi:MAG: helix-turn-helix transcriptional regulator, partial [Spirochaetales bacterium]|nr:helix-turn-helix transcriptional regulator [Spirochaetales bacterium]
YLVKRGRSADPRVAVALQLLLVTLWSIMLPGDLPLAGFYLLVLYGSSLYLRVNLVLFTAASGIVLMNLGYLYGLAVSGGLPVREALGGLPANPFNWPGFQAQIFSTLILLFFAYVFPGRQRIIRRMIGRQQAYFEMVRDQNSPLSDSLELFARNFGLSSREEEVLAVLILGKTYRMIAGELFISLDTVKSHVKNIYRKCGVGSREELLEVLRQSILVSSQGREDLK